MDFNEVLQQSNEDFNNQILNNKTYSPLEVFDIPLLLNEEVSIGGCIRKTTFELFNLPKSYNSLYLYEKEYKYDKLKELSFYKIKQYLKDKKNLKLSKPQADIRFFYGARTITFTNDMSLEFNDNMILFDVIESDKDFNYNDKTAVMKYMPAAITLLERTKNNVVPINKVVVITKHAHNHLEKAIEFTKAEYKDEIVLVIDNKPTSFVIEKYYNHIIKAVEDIIKNYKNKQLSKIKNKNMCKNCFYKDLCETM